MTTQRKIGIEVSQTGNARQSLSETAKVLQDLGRVAKETQAGYSVSMKELEDSEKRYQSLLQSRSRVEQEANRRASDRKSRDPFGGLGSAPSPGKPQLSETPGLGANALSGLGSRALDVGKAAQGLASGGGLGSLVGAGHPAAMAFTAVTQGVEKTAKAIEIFSNSTLTGAHGLEKFTAEFVPGGRALIAFRDAVTGVAERIRLAEYAFQDKSLLQNQRLEKNLLTSGSAAEIEAAKNKGSAFAGLANNPLAAPNLDRSTFQGDIEQQKQMRLFPLQQNVARATALSQAANKDHSASQARLAKLQGELSPLQEKMRVAQDRERATVEKENKTSARANSPLGKVAGYAQYATLPTIAAGLFQRDKAGRQETGRESMLAQAEVAKQIKEIETEINREKQLGIGKAEQESAIRKANIGIAKEELAFAKEKEQRLTGQAQRLGGMNKFERQAGLQAVRLVKEAKGNFDSLPPQLLAMAQQFAPEFVRKEQEKFGQTTEEGRAGVAEGFLEKGDLRAIREEVAHKAAKVEVGIHLDEAALATQIVNVLERSIKSLIKAIDIRHEAEMGRIRSGRQIAQNSQ